MPMGPAPRTGSATEARLANKARAYTFLVSVDFGIIVFYFRQVSLPLARIWHASRWKPADGETTFSAPRKR